MIPEDVNHILNNLRRSLIKADYSLDYGTILIKIDSSSFIYSLGEYVYKAKGEDSSVIGIHALHAICKNFSSRHIFDIEIIGTPHYSTEPYLWGRAVTEKYFSVKDPYYISPQVLHTAVFTFVPTYEYISIRYVTQEFYEKISGLAVSK